LPRRERHIFRVCSARGLNGEPVEEIEGVADLLDRITTQRLRIIERDPRIKRAIASATSSGSQGGSGKNLRRALILGLRACQREACPNALGSMHRQLQNAFRKSSDPRLARQRHEYTRHGAGQLEGLLVSGYCQLFKASIVARILRITVITQIWRRPLREIIRPGGRVS
jgi:hypothetical protein